MTCPPIDYSDMNVSPAHWDPDYGRLTHWECCIDLPCDCYLACFDPVNHPTDLEGNPIHLSHFEEDYYGETFQEKVRNMKREDRFTTLAQFIRAEEKRIAGLTVSGGEKAYLRHQRFVVARQKYKAQVARLANHKNFVERAKWTNFRTVPLPPKMVRIKLKPKPTYIEIPEDEIEFLSDCEVEVEVEVENFVSK
jgi:hypothetical protein